MIIQQEPPLHLTYCLNVHPGETWPEILAALSEKTLTIKSRVAPGQPFGVGLRLGDTAARELAQGSCLSEFKDFLKRHDLYVFTLNGFPYGDFHGTRIKEDVYHPDWRTEERVTYTHLLANLLADLLPEGMCGSISTVPCSFRPWLAQPADVSRVVSKLVDSALHLAKLKEDTGKEIHLGLEPEPGCHLETTQDSVSFFNDRLLVEGIEMACSRVHCDVTTAEQLLRTHLGVCVDVCHGAVQFEDPAHSLRRLAAEGIRVSKVQLSAALDLPCSEEGLTALQPFDEPVYLHQVRARMTDGSLLGWTDLPEALAALPGVSGCERIRVHFHVPLFWEGTETLRSTASCMSQAFWDAVRSGVCEHLEIETYTFDVLPPALRSADITEGLVQEFSWATCNLDRRSSI